MAKTPQSGDVIIRKHSAQSLTPFTLGTHHGEEQLSIRTYDAALARADGFARHVGVDVWYSEDGESYQCLAEHRPHFQPSGAP